MGAPKPNFLHKLTLGQEKGRFEQYLEYSQATSQVAIKGFLGGLAKGFGIVLGATVVAAVVVGLLAVLGSVISGGTGDFIQGLANAVNQNARST